MNADEARLLAVYEMLDLVEEKLLFIDECYPGFRSRTKTLRVEMEELLDRILLISAHRGWPMVAREVDLMPFRERFTLLMDDVIEQMD